MAQLIKSWRNKRNNSTIRQAQQWTVVALDSLGKSKTTTKITDNSTFHTNLPECRCTKELRGVEFIPELHIISTLTPHFRCKNALTSCVYLRSKGMEKCGVCVRFVWGSRTNSTRFKPSVDKGLRRFVWNVGFFLKKLQDFALRRRVK